MKKIFALALIVLLATSLPALADKNISQFTPNTTITQTDLLPFWSTELPTATATSYIPVANFLSTVCGALGASTACGTLLGFVTPPEFGGFCGARWNINDNTQDDAPAINLGLASGFPVFITKCKTATSITYSGQGQMLISNTTTMLNDTNGAFPSGPTGQIFIPNNLASTAKNCAIDFAGHNDIGLYGINERANFDAIGSAGYCNSNSNADGAGTTFVYTSYIAASNVGMGFGGPTDSAGVPQTAGGTSGVGFYGGNIQLVMQHFTFAHAAWGVRLNASDFHFHDGYIANTVIALAAFNQFTGGGSLDQTRIEFNGKNTDFGSITPITIGTSAIYPNGAAPVTGVVYVGSFADWSFTNVEFEDNTAPNIDVEGGSRISWTGGHTFQTGQGGVPSGSDSEMFIGTGATGGGRLLVSNIFFIPSGGHPVNCVSGGTTGSEIGITNSSGTCGATKILNLSANPTNMNIDILGAPQQRLNYSSGIDIGTALPLSTMDIGGNMSIGTYAGSVAAPSNGLIVSGVVGVGTSNPLNSTVIDARGLVTVNGIIANGTPTVASGCGTVGSVTGGATTFSFTAGATSCAPVLTLPTAPNGWRCVANDLTNTGDAFVQTAKSVTSCTLSATVSSSDVILVHAEAY